MCCTNINIVVQYEACFHGRKHSQTIFTIEILIKILVASTCMIDFFGRTMATSDFCDDRKFALSLPGKTRLCRGRNKNCVDKVVGCYSLTCCCFETSSSFPKYPSKYLFGTNDDSFYMSALFRRIIHQQAPVSSLETCNSNLESQTIVLLSKYVE